MRLAVRAEPHVVSPNVLEAEELVGHEFRDETTARSPSPSCASWARARRS